MKKIKSLTALFLFTLIAFCKAQDTTITSVKKRLDRKPSLGVFISPDYCIENFNAIGDNPAAVKYYKKRADSLNDVISPSWGYSIGIDAVFPLKGERFSIKTGLYYTMRTIQYNGFVYDNAITPDFNIYWLGAFRKERMSVFEVPVALDYSILTQKKGRKFRLNGFAGIIFFINNAEYKVQIKRLWVDYNAPQLESSYAISSMGVYSTYSIGLMGGIKTEYMFNERWAFSLSPMAKYYPFEFYKNDPVPPFENRVNKRFISIGCGIGVTYHFD